MKKKSQVHHHMCATCKLQSTIIIAVAIRKHLSAPTQISTDGNMTLGWME